MSLVGVLYYPVAKPSAHMLDREKKSYKINLFAGMDRQTCVALESYNNIKPIQNIS